MYILIARHPGSGDYGFDNDGEFTIHQFKTIEETAKRYAEYRIEDDKYCNEPTEPWILIVIDDGKFLKISDSEYKDNDQDIDNRFKTVIEKIDYAYDKEYYEESEKIFVDSSLVEKSKAFDKLVDQYYNTGEQ